MPRESNPLVVGRLIGDVLDPFTPTTEIRISCDGRMICNGARLRPSQIATRPRVGIGGPADAHNLYTIVMVDVDAPSPGNPYLREYLHWLVINNPGSTETASGNEIVSYEGPQPSMGIHRFVMVVFEQLYLLDMSAPEWRQNFSIRQFAELFNLGPPVAALYFNCHRESGAGGRRPN